MNKHHTKEKGDLGVFKVAADLADKGYNIFFSPSEHLPFDLIIYKDNAFKRVSIKYRKLTNNRIAVPFKSSWADKKGNHIKLIDKNEIDIIAVFCPDTNKCYYIDPKNHNKSVYLSISKPVNNKKINFADDFLLP